MEVKGGQSTKQTAAQLGKSVKENAGTGGGGGSFVYTRADVLLLAAGGRGGASGGYNGVEGQAGSSGTSSVGKESSQARNGGTNEQPGKCNRGHSLSWRSGCGLVWPRLYPTRLLPWGKGRFTGSDLQQRCKLSSRLVPCRFSSKFRPFVSSER